MLSYKKNSLFPQGATLMPKQLPISPPYKTACLLKKHGALDKASYSSSGCTATTNISSNKDNIDSQTDDTEGIKKVEHLSLDDASQGEMTTTKNVSDPEIL